MIQLNLRNLSDEVLLKNTKIAVKKETEQMLVVLYHIKEVDRRRLYSSLGFQNLKEYCVKELKYSESTAYARIDAMKALRDLPEMEEKIRAGEITFSNIVLAQKFIRREEKLGKEISKVEKAEIFAELENKSERTAEKILMAKNPEHIQFEESVRRLTHEYLEFRCTVTDAFLEKLELLRGILAHKLPKASKKELLERAMEMAIELLTPKEPRRNKSEVKQQVKSEKSSAQLIETDQNQRDATQVPELAPLSRKNPNQRSPIIKNIQAIPAQIKREVRARAQNKCENCNSTYALEFDHRVPRAKGGTNNLENIRLLCRNCNARAAIVAYGVGNMERYLFREF